MPDISLNKGSFTDLTVLASGLGDPSLEEKVEELRTFAGSGCSGKACFAQGGRASAGGGSAFGGSSATTAITLKSAWAGLYGADVNLWPQRLKDSLETIEAGVGWGHFGQNLTSAFQNLRLEDTTVAAFEVGMAVVAKLALPEIAEQALQLQTRTEADLIPESAARAGLSFISNPLALVVPIWFGGIAGRAATGLTANAGRALSLADNAVAGLATLFGLTGEAAGFVATSHVIANNVGHPRESGDPVYSGDSRFRGNDTTTFFSDTASASLFFASLRLFGWAGQTLGSMLAVSETGIALAKLTQHASSITGLAFTEGIQEAAGIGEPVCSGEACFAESGRASSATTFWERIVRATFLHGTITSINGIARFEPARTPVTVVTKGIESALRRFMDIRQPLFQTEGQGKMPSFDKFRMSDLSDKPPRDGTIGPKAGEKPPGGIEETVRLLKEHGFDLPAQEYITQLLPKIGRFVGAINPEAWGETSASEFSKKLRAADHDILKYVHEVVDTAGGASFLLLLDRLGLVPNKIKLAIQLAINDAARKRAEEGTVNAAAYTLASSYQTKYGEPLDKGPIMARLADLPQELVRLLNNLTPFPESHLKTAEELGVLDLPR